MKWAAVTRPRVVVIENVAAFLKSRVWGLVARRLQRLGYHVHASVHDAVDFGVPQRRARSVTFATLRDEIVLPTRRREPVTVAEAWAGLPRRPDERADAFLPPTKLALARMRLIPPGGDKRDVMRRAPRLAAPSWWRSRVEVTDVWGRMEWDKPANTLRTEFVNVSKGRYIHPEQHRGISLREAARLHSIPDEFEVASRVPYVFARLVGNSVPPLLGRAIARAVARALG